MRDVKLKYCPITGKVSIYMSVKGIIFKETYSRQQCIQNRELLCYYLLAYNTFHSNHDMLPLSKDNFELLDEMIPDRKNWTHKPYDMNDLYVSTHPEK